STDVGEGSSGSEMEPDLAPFSLEELGLSQAEIDSLDSLGGEARAEAPLPTGDSSTDVGEGSSGSEMEPDLAPFSLEELGLSQTDIDGLDDLQSSSKTNEVDDQKATDIGASALSIGPVDTSNEVPSELQPFSLDEIDMSGVGDSTLPVNDLSSSLQPFSLDDAVANIENEDRDIVHPESREQSSDDSLSQTQGYSWQEPPQRSERNFLTSDEDIDVEEGLSIFAKLKQRKQSDPSTPTDESDGSENSSLSAEEVSQSSDDGISLFSVDNVSLRDDSDTDDLPSLSTGADSTDTESLQSSQEFESLEAAISSGEVQPFSLSDLGLSDDEIAALGLGGEAQSDSITFGEQNSTMDYSTQTISDQPIEDTLPSVPESIDGGLDDIKDVAQENIDLASQEEIDLDTDTSGSETLSASEDSLMMSDLKPFSLSDLGLSDDEIAALGLGASENDDSAATGLGITEDELAGLDIGGEASDELKSTPPISSVNLSEENTDVVEEPSLDTDPVIDQLVSLGRRQGFIDIADIIAHFEDPEAEADRIEEVGRVLHEASIQIRDGDEIIDMNDEYADDIEDGIGEISSPQSQYDSVLEEPNMTPFSLSELGLSDDEISSLGVESSSSEDDITFGDDQSALSSSSQSTNSFSGDGMLGAGDDTHDIHPFSFTELNLSNDIDSKTNQPDTTSNDIDLEAPVSLNEQKNEISRQSETDLPRQDDLTQQPSSQDNQGHSAKMQHDSEQIDASVSPELNMYMDRLAAEPHNHILRLSVARISGQTGSTDMAVQQYKQLIKNNTLLDDVVEDLQDLILDVDQSDRRTLQRLHRTLGDAYSKQGRFQEAMEEYSWTFSGNNH
ncbi:MAG: RNA polymerase sigma factor region1.1 domain-containing protein, partial [Chloroflexota bacterium]